MIRLLGILVACLGATTTWAQDPLPIETVPAAASGPVLDYANNLYQRQWVRKDDSGAVSGRLFVLSTFGREPIGAAEISLTLEGETIYQTQPEFDGTFRIENVPVGTYALIVSGKTTFAAFALHILPTSEDHLPAHLDVLSSSITPSQAKSLVMANLIPRLDTDTEYYRVFESDPLGASRIDAREAIALTPDGTLTGTVSRPGWRMGEQDMSGNIAQILKDGRVIGSAAVNRSGTFNVKNILPGTYDLVVSGGDGFAVVPFQAIQVDDLASVNTGNARFVSANVISTLNLELIGDNPGDFDNTYPPDDPTQDDSNDPLAPPPNQPYPLSGTVGPSGGAAGFGGVGGGGSGGGVAGGLGGLGGAAGLAVGIAALADDDDGFNLNVSSAIAPPE